MLYGKQYMTMKTTIYVHPVAETINATPSDIQNGPGVTFRRLLSICGKMAARYESVERTTNEPTNALNAVIDPT
jgi:hypothetical protein